MGQMFLEAQDYVIEHNVLLQDNKSTILLATSGIMSSSKEEKKHILHRFFLVKDRVESGDVEIAYKPTGSMWCDILTKPK